MEKVFVEYAIADETLEEYRAFMTEKRRSGAGGDTSAGTVEGEDKAVGSATALGRFEWYEGTDQSGLFVEIWPDLSYEAYGELKRRRTNPADPEWGKLADWVRGGLSKVHVWHFTACG